MPRRVAAIRSPCSRASSDMLAQTRERSAASVYFGAKRHILNSELPLCGGRRPPFLPTTPEQDRGRFFAFSQQRDHIESPEVIYRVAKRHIARRSRISPASEGGAAAAVRPPVAAVPGFAYRKRQARSRRRFLDLFLSSPISKKVDFLHLVLFKTVRESAGNATFEHSNACSRPEMPPIGRSFRQFEQGFEHFAPPRGGGFQHTASARRCCADCTTTPKNVNK